MEKPLKTDERYPVTKLEKLMSHASPQRTGIQPGATYNMSPLQPAQQQPIPNYIQKEPLERAK